MKNRMLIILLSCAMFLLSACADKNDTGNDTTTASVSPVSESQNHTELTSENSIETVLNDETSEIISMFLICA